jgi:hypothetical protein
MIMLRSCVSPRPPLWVVVKGPGFDSRRHQIFLVEGLERGPLNLANTIEKLLERNSSGSGLEIRECCLGDPLC